MFSPALRHSTTGEPMQEARVVEVVDVVVVDVSGPLTVNDEYPVKVSSFWAITMKFAWYMPIGASSGTAHLITYPKRVDELPPYPYP
jgi:hypothetical protein